MLFGVPLVVGIELTKKHGTAKSDPPLTSGGDNLLTANFLHRAVHKKQYMVVFQEKYFILR